MLSFESDYIEGAHPLILQKLVETNMEQMSGYGLDPYCASAKEKIKRAAACPEGDVYFFSGGTQTNALIIDTMLRPFEGVVAAATGHVALHEGGAIEMTGHKVLTLPGYDGKLSAEEVRTYLAGFYADGNHEHMVFPGMVYISHPTENGTIYKKQELADLYAVCRAYDIPLFIDGARLGYGLMSDESDMTLADVAANCDIFYIGGTKVGALCGEAVVFTNHKDEGGRIHHGVPLHFTTLIKQHGALMAKGRLLGIQFDVLFTDDLYFKISRHAIDMAGKLRDLFRRKGYPFLMESPTNQQFVILENEEMARLSAHVAFCFWENVDPTHTGVRFAASWATTEENIAKLETLLVDHN
ncbi:MAG: beta-eliminating lyase-related protein [Lachnospiraceae bacterium]|nr:beta-eliminating lyase-related protein [Lachnospiraceae bacterium]